MADPLLTTLCAICHISAPKYKCPRCNLRTCSLACTRKHKSWSSCSGIRDVTAYLPPSKLRTPAGVDHDYNFISAIERSRQRSEKAIVEERALVREEELRPITLKTVQWRRRRDGSKKKVLVTEVLRGEAREMDKGVRKRLGRFDIRVRRAPVGMVRERENGTSLSRSSGKINWQVEWLVFQAATPDTQEAHTTRILSKVIDDTPLYKAFASGQKAHLEASLRKEEHHDEAEADAEAEGEAEAVPQHTGRHRKHRRPNSKDSPANATAQDAQTGAWHTGRYSLQDYISTAWPQFTGYAPFTGVSEEDEIRKKKHSFFLTNPDSHSDKTALYILDAEDTLTSALSHRTVLEFPTIYVLESSSTLPAGFVLEPKPQRQSQKRKRNASSQNKARKAAKHSRQDLEDGQIPIDLDDQAKDEDSEGLDEEFERAEIVAEESMGEEDGAADTTSSSGSDSESDSV